MIPISTAGSSLLMPLVTAQYSASQIKGKINDVQKQIATKKKVDYIYMPGSGGAFC